MHGVWAWQAGASHYHIGAFLLDLEEPWKVIGKTRTWLLAPEEDYETRGTVNDVVFPCGALADLETDECACTMGRPIPGSVWRQVLSQLLFRPVAKAGNPDRRRAARNSAGCSAL